MKTTRFLFLTLFLLLLLGSTAEPAAACSCMPGTPADYVGYADVIFVGEVVEIDRPALSFSSADSINVRFAVSETWETGLPADVTIQTSGDEASCGYTFNIGATYLVYASDRDGTLDTGLCSGTKSVGDAGADLEFLGPSVAPVAETPSDAPQPIIVMLIVGAGFLALAAVGTLMVRLLQS